MRTKHLNSPTVHLGLAVLAISMLPALAGCGSKPPKKGLVKDLETLMPVEPQVPPAASEVPKNAAILYADDLAGVTRVSLEPEETVPGHPTDRRILYFLTGGTLRVDLGGQTQSIPVAPGDVRFFSPGSYILGNAGQQTLAFLEVDRTDVDLPADLAALTGGGVPPGDILFSNPQVRVWTLDIQPNEEAELPQVPIRIVYSTDAMVLSFTGAGGQAEEVHVAAGEAFGRAGSDVSLEDVGIGGGKVVVFEWLV